MDYHGNTQLNMNLQFYYERETLKKVHQFGITNQSYTFKYLDSGIQQIIDENFYSLNYTYYNRIKLDNWEVYSGAGVLFSILNEQKKYKFSSTNLVSTNSAGDILKIALFIEEKIILPTNSKKNKFKQALNFRFGFDFGGIKNNNATFVPVISFSGGYSLFYCF